jgi:chorismate lyase/3-hydroxybenzoate synthase
MTVTTTEAAGDAGAWPALPYRIESAGPAGTCLPLPDHALCEFRFDAVADPDAESDPRRILFGLEALPGADAGDLWLSQLPVRHGRDEGIAYSENGAVLMFQLRLDEAALAAMEEAVYQAYLRIAAFSVARGYPELWRVWHYLGRINQGEGDEERYRRFCVGRHRAVADGRDFELKLPAATAIGSHGGGLHIVVLAGKRAGLQVENPRQVSAFRYPRPYGLRSPSFSRATLLPCADGARLLVSGTASIVGHATVFAGDTAAQLRQIADNLQALLENAVQTRFPGQAAGRFVAESYIVYLRHAEELPRVQAVLDELFGDAPRRLVIGDICRRELLIEVEATYRMKGV